MTKVNKTTFGKEQQEKEEAWLKLTGEQRLEIIMRLKELTRKKGVNYSYEGQKVTVKRGEPLQ
jgi:hypothetical protein